MTKNFWQKIEKPILALAPMAGITDSAFRQICRLHGADVTYSEMASVSALFHKPQKTLELVRFNKKERPYIVQLFGNKPEHFAVATKIITAEVKPDGIDINFGCPAKKVFKHGSGCALMPQVELAREVISAVCDNTDLPVSIKIRAGLKDFNALEFIKKTKDFPYCAVMVHGRTYEGGFSGTVNWELISKIKEIIPEKIVLGNGGITTPEGALEILQKYPNIDGLGIARGAWGKPYLFEQIKDLIEKIHPVKYAFGVLASQEFNRVKKIMLTHAKLIFADKAEMGKFEIRKHLVWYIKGFPGASELRRKLVRAESVKEIKEILK
ncbi:MAG: tRNA-dihydrouridine synthase [Candidatus Moraniibacteriota bacterium]